MGIVRGAQGICNAGKMGKTCQKLYEFTAFMGEFG